MKTAEEWSKDLLQEHERAIKQRDTFILTGICTAGYGGSYDICFGYIVRQIQLDAYKAGMTEAADICGKDSFLLKHPEEWVFLLKKKEEILSTRDNKKTI